MYRRTYCELPSAPYPQHTMVTTCTDVHIVRLSSAICLYEYARVAICTDAHIVSLKQNKQKMAVFGYNLYRGIHIVRFRQVHNSRHRAGCNLYRRTYCEFDKKERTKMAKPLQLIQLNL